MKYAGQPWRILLSHDRLTGCLVASGTMTSARTALTRQYATTAAAIGSACPGHVKCPVVPPSAL